MQELVQGVLLVAALMDTTSGQGVLNRGAKIWGLDRGDGSLYRPQTERWPLSAAELKIGHDVRLLSPIEQLVGEPPGQIPSKVRRRIIAMGREAHVPAWRKQIETGSKVSL